MSSSSTRSKRPLSPHLQIYRLPLTALMSISHRASGAALVLGIIYVAAWLISAAMGQGYYDKMMAFAQSGLGTVILFAWSLALFYHLCNGIRHLLWDIGIGLNKRGAHFGNKLVIAVALTLTIMLWWVCCDQKPIIDKTPASVIGAEDLSEGREE
ncbi:MAG: succinate dehydrogenase, cytochrome b556 subunit [Pseudomonadota bacterium]